MNLDQNTRTDFPSGFTDYPSKAHQEDYGPAREYLAERAAEIPGLLGLYEYGTVHAPGISDIDLIAVIDEKIEPTVALEFLEGSRSPAHVARVLDQGTIKPVSQTLLKRIQILGKIGIKPIFATDPITPTSSIESHQIFIEAANIADWLPERILMLRSLLGRQTLSCRRVLGGLGSFRHSASTVSNVLGYEPQQAIKFSNYYDELRSEWFNRSESDNFDATITLINLGISTGQSLIEVVTEKLIELEIFVPNNSAIGSAFWLNNSKAFALGNTNDDTLHPQESTDLLVQTIPASWISVFTAYGSVPGKFSSLVSSNLELNQTFSPKSVSDEFSTVLIKRIQWINESYEFLNALGLAHLMYRFSHLRSH